MPKIVSCGMYLPGLDGTFQRDCSEKTTQEIDVEVKKILDRGYAEAKEILEQHRDQLKMVADELLRCETMDAHTFNRLIGREPLDDERSLPGLEAAPQTLAKI